MQAALDFQERRSTPRYCVVRQLQVSNMRTGEPLGNVVNLSSQGFMLLGATQLSSGDELALRLGLPGAAVNEHYVTLKARCMWCAQSSFSSDYGAGFEVTRMTAADQARLQRWLQAAM